MQHQLIIFEDGVVASLLRSAHFQGKHADLLRSHSTVPVACALLLVQVVVIWRFGGRIVGTWVSDVVQLLLGMLCVLESIRAFRHSAGIGRYYWRWLTATFGIWVAAQALGVFIDATGRGSLDPLDNLLFFLSGIPFGMLLFLDPDHEDNRFDRLHLLDFLQVCGFWVCVYLYFSKDQDFGLTDTGWGPFGWSTSLVFNGVLALSFVLRAVVTDSSTVRGFFGKMSLFLFFSGLADSYFSFTPNQVQPGGWFDLVWSAFLFMPVVIAATWKEMPSSSVVPKRRAQRIVVNQFFPLLYPFFSLLLIADMAGRKQVLSTCLGGVIFATVGVRVLIIQHRLMGAQEMLQFEATHDALTGLFNRRAILECLERELERQKRIGDSVGLIIADADHFKNINDAYGHMVGDQVLHEMARRMLGSLRSYDWVGRYGGEEFLIVVPHCGGKDAVSSAERLRKSVADSPVSTNAGSIPVTVSVGLIAITGCSEGVDCSMLVRMADEALYSAKARGRNRVEGAFLWGTELTTACSNT